MINLESLPESLVVSKIQQFLMENITLKMFAVQFDHFIYYITNTLNVELTNYFTTLFQKFLIKSVEKIQILRKCLNSDQLYEIHLDVLTNCLTNFSEEVSYINLLMFYLFRYVANL